MSEFKKVDDFRDELAHCVRCGACQAHCPVYLETGEEGSVARGKLVLAANVLSGQVQLNDRLNEELGLCLLCGSCVVGCPNHVPTDAIVGALRRSITDDRGLSPVGKKVATLTGSPALMKTVAKSGSLLSPLLFKEIPETSGLRLRFSPEMFKDRSLPPLPKKNLFDRVPEFLQGDADKPVVGIFAGCTLTYLYPQVGELLVRLPHLLGYSVVFPKTQGCCGMPGFSSGNEKLITKLSETNINAFSARKPSVILTGCASCHGMITEHYSEKTALPFGVPVLDIHEFLVQEGIVERLAALPRQPEQVLVTYHDPCHLRTAGVTQEPRELLKALPQARYVEMKNAGICCGFGGTFTANHPELSRSIGDRKVEGLRDSGASLVASPCPGCILQLQDIIDRAGLPMRAVHTLELIMETLAPELPKHA